MAKLCSFIVCESLNSLPGENGLVPMLVAPQIALRPQFVPGNFSFGLAFGISEINLKVNNKFRFNITSPDGAIVYDTGEKELPVLSKPDTLPPEYQGFSMTTDIRNLAVPCEGAYSFSIYLNGDEIATKKVPIFKKVD